MGIFGIAGHAVNGARAIWRLTGHEPIGALEEGRYFAKALKAQEKQAGVQQATQEISTTPPQPDDPPDTGLTDGDGGGVLGMLGEAWDWISDQF
jgi:hypothetical protein